MDVSFQLYSARDNTSWKNLVRDIARLGYTQTEGFPGVYGDPDGFRRLLDAHGLTMPSGHFPLDMLENDLARALDIRALLGISRIYCPMLEQADRPSDRTGWRAFAARLQTVQKDLSEAGIEFGWHNHDYEFLAAPDGTIPMREILDGAPDIGWEADIAWIVRGGDDPMDWIERYGCRIGTAHVKDIAPPGLCTDEDGWADVGHGTLDWRALKTALHAAGCDLYVVEHDKPSDIRRFARRSIAALRSY